MAFQSRPCFSGTSYSLAWSILTPFLHYVLGLAWNCLLHHWLHHFVTAIRLWVDPCESTFAWTLGSVDFPLRDHHLPLLWASEISHKLLGHSHVIGSHRKPSLIKAGCWKCLYWVNSWQVRSFDLFLNGVPGCTYRLCFSLDDHGLTSSLPSHLHRLLQTLQYYDSSQPLVSPWLIILHQKHQKTLWSFWMQAPV